MHEQSPHPPQPPPSTPNGKIFQPPARPADIASVYNSDDIVGLPIETHRTVHVPRCGRRGTTHHNSVTQSQILAPDVVLYKLSSFSSMNDEQACTLH